MNSGPKSVAVPRPETVESPTASTTETGAGATGANEPPAGVEVLEAAADSALSAGKPKVALRQIRKALALAPKRKSSLRIFCLAQRALGQGAKAESACLAAGVEAADVSAVATGGAAAAPGARPAAGNTAAPAANPSSGEHDAYQVDFLH
jgi:hypothetical protein